MERRQNDIFMSMLANPQASFDNIVTVGLTAANTSLQDRSTYANNKYVQELYKEMPKIILGGRLGKYKYFDMDDTIAEAFRDANNMVK